MAREAFTAEAFEEGWKPVTTQLIDGRVVDGSRALPEELVLLFREVRALRREVRELAALLRPETDG